MTTTAKDGSQAESQDSLEPKTTNKQNGHIPESDPGKGKTGLQIFQEVLGTLGGMAVFILAVSSALLFHLGRVYTNSVVLNLGISSTLVMLSAGEYYELGFPYFVEGVIAGIIVIIYVFMLKVIYVHGLLFLLPLNIILDALWGITRHLIGRIIPRSLVSIIQKLLASPRQGIQSLRTKLPAVLSTWWESRQNVYRKRYNKLDDELIKRSQQTYKVYLILILILFGAYVAVTWLYAMEMKAKDGGSQRARQTVNGSVFHAKIIATEPLVFDSPLVLSKTTEVDGENLYSYSGLYFIFYHNERYFLFDTLNAECLPKQVYVIPDEIIRHVEYTLVTPVFSHCPVAATPTVVSPSPTVVIQPSPQNITPAVVPTTTIISTP